MNEFCELYWQLDGTTKTTEKVAALKRYFSRAESKDAVWAIYFLVGRRIKRLIPTKLLRQWTLEQADISGWLFDECYDRVGDLAETISLILPNNSTERQFTLSDLIENHLLPLRDDPLEQQKRTVLELWDSFDQQQLFVLGKLMTGGFRVGVSRRLVNRAISEFTEIDAATIAHRLMGEWEPTEAFYQQLVDPDESASSASKPYPFFLANPLQQEVQSLGESTDWMVEWKWDGVRAQLIRRDGDSYIWSRGEDLVTDQFPEIASVANYLNDGTVIDGEILAWDRSGDRPLEFSQLQRRLGRKKIGKGLLEKVPVVMLAFDLLEVQGEDVRDLSLHERRQKLEAIIGRLVMPDETPPGQLFADPKMDKPPLRLSPIVAAESWEDIAKHRQNAKQMRAEGLMLKRLDSKYQVGRPVGDWWKWKVEPYTVDAVLVYAQRGHGRRASLYSDYTFAVWNAGQLVPFAKAYSGLTDAEMRRVDAFIRKNTKERFGPVRSVTPELVFELAFENIQRSTRHKSGVAVRFPRINRWRHDKGPQDADSMDTILAMLEAK